jgi:hypothetical protein
MTPLGVVRYSAAKLSIDVTPFGAGPPKDKPEAPPFGGGAPKDKPGTTAVSAAVAVSQGVAFVWPAEDARGPAARPDAEGWVRIENDRVTLQPKAPGQRPPDAAAAAATVCTRMAQESHTLAAALLGGSPLDAGAADGATAATRQVRARRLARAACGVALLRTQALAPAEGDAVLQAVRAADSAWRSLPSQDE